MIKKAWYIDNLRLLLALFVVMWHSANAYTGSGGWPIREMTGSGFVYGIKTLLDAFTMPLFFYISGYFAIPSLLNRSTGEFLKGKTKRILVPWILSLLIIIPFVEFLSKLGQDTPNLGYLEVWLWQMGRMFDLHIGIINGEFYQRYMWFISVLFTFYLLIALVFKVFPKWFQHSPVREHNREFTQGKIVKQLFVMLGITAIPMMVVILSVMFLTESHSSEPFFSFFNIIQFQSSRVLIYLTYFLLGFFSYRNGWMKRGFLQFRKLWAGLFLITGILFFSMMNVLNNILPDEAFGPLFIISINVFIFSTLGFALSFARMYWDRPLLGDGDLSSHAFNIYILHYVYVYGLQLILLGMPAIPLVIKFIIVTGVAFILSYYTSNYLLKPHPRITLAAGVLITLVLIVVT